LEQNIKQIKLLRLHKKTLIDKEYHGETIEVTDENRDNIQQVIDELHADEEIVGVRLVMADGSIKKIKRFIISEEW